MVVRVTTARQVLDDALNGDRDRIDPATRRGLVAVATRVDDNNAAVLEALAALQKRVTLVGGSVSTTFLAAAAALFAKL